MPSLFSHLFGRNGGGLSPEPAINEDLECGHEFSCRQTLTASGYQTPLGRLYLPETQSVLAPIVPQAPTPGCEYFTHMKCNDQDGSAVQAPLTPGGPSRVIGYFPRTMCNGPSPIVEPTQRLNLPSPRSQNASNGGGVGNSGPQCRSTLISSAVSSRSPSPTPPLDPDKHGVALQRSESLDLFKNIPPSYQDSDRVDGSAFFSKLGVVVSAEEYAAGLRDSRPQQPGRKTSADVYQTTDYESGVNISWPSIKHLPDPVYRPFMLNEEDRSRIANPTERPQIESGQTFTKIVPSSAYRLPNTEANKSSQGFQHALHLSQVLPKPHETVPSELNYVKIMAADGLPDLLSKNPCTGGLSENDKLDRKVSIFRSGPQDDKQYANISVHGVEEKKEQQSYTKGPDRERTHQNYNIVQSPVFEEIDEYTWSPAPSDDGREALSAPQMRVSHHVPSNVLRTSPPSGLVSDSHRGLLHSIPYGDEPSYSRSKLSNNSSGVDRLLPHINILVPAGSIDLASHSDFLSSSQHASMMGNGEVSGMLLRYSGIIKDDSSSRPMSKTELEEAALHSLEDQMKTDSSMLNWKDSSIQLDNDTNFKQIRREREPNARSEALPLVRGWDPSVDGGPGSSQTSSLSTDRYIGDFFGHKASSVLPSSTARCPAPPPMFGKKAVCEAERYESSKSALGGIISRSDRILKANKLEETDKFPAALCSLGDQDWETVSAETEAQTHAVDGIASNTKSGSSLADNSDSWNLSLSREMLPPFRSIRACPVLQHPAHPRHNYSFMLLKNSQTGDLVQVPQYEYTSSGYVPINNASSQLVLGTRADSTYHHPSPLRIEHKHPLRTLQPSIHFEKPSVIGADNVPIIVRQDHLKSESSSPGLSASVEEEKSNQINTMFCKTARDISSVPRDVSRILFPAVDQDQRMLRSKEQSHQSSAWLSTVSEVESSEPSLPGNGHRLTRAVGGDRNAHVNGTSDRRGHREVGSSLADTSSPGPNFSSSPTPLASSIIEPSDTPPFSVQNIHKQAIPHKWEVGSQHVLVDSHKSLARSFNDKGSAISTSTSNNNHHCRYFSACGPQHQHRKFPPHRHSSSSESYSRLVDSPFGQKVPALSLSSSDGHAQQLSSSGLLSRNKFLHSDEIDTGYNPSPPNVIERKGRQPKADDSSTDDLCTPSTIDSRSSMQNEALDTDLAPPMLFHSCDGRGRPWDRFMPGTLRPRSHPIALGGPLFQRPVAQAESPHLHRIPHAPNPELLERHILLSRVYLILTMAIPPITLLYGHGYMDGILRLHTEGKMNSFRSTEKTIALCWGYGLSVICIFAIVIAMIIISASA